MYDTKIDKRSIRTRAAIQSSLLRLLNQFNLDEISIKGLCENAGVNRTTFYLHYTGVNDVLVSIREDFVKRVIDKYPAPSSAKGEGAYIAFLKTVNDEIDKTPMFEKFICTSSEAGNFIKRLKDSFSDKIYALLLPDTLEDKKEHCSYITTFLCSGVIDTYFLWLKNGKKTSLDVFCKTISALLQDGHSHFLK